MEGGIVLFKSIIIILLNTIIGIHMGYAETVESYEIKDFISSGLFPNQYGVMSTAPSCLTCPTSEALPADYDSINAAFQGAVERYYPQAARIRKSIFGYNPSETTNVPISYDNKELLYSYWIATDGVFCVIWQEAFVDNGTIDFAAGRAFYFSRPSDSATISNKIDNVYDLIEEYGIVFSLDNLMVPNWLLSFTMHFHRVIYGECTSDGFVLKCCLVRSDRKILLDITPILGREFKELSRYINALEDILWNQP